LIKPVSWKTHMELVSSSDLQAIHEASLRIMERTGLFMPLSPERQEQAGDLGLRVDRDTHRVCFPPAVVEAAIRQAPRSYTLCGRNPENDLVLDGRHGYLSLDGCGTDVVDMETGEVRPSTLADLEAAIRIADALPQISFLWPVVSARDCPASVQPLYELQAMLTQSSKHAQAMTVVDPLNARATVEIAAEVAGGRKALRDRPVVSTFQCSFSPLSYERNALEAAFVFGEAGIPTGFLDMTIGCGTAPATVAGNAALANAEVLAGITLFELFYPGAPTFYGSCSTMMELRSGGVTCGGPEDLLLQAVACQLARLYGFPSSIGTFATGAKIGDWHAGVDNALSCAVSQLCGADLMSGAGLLNAARIFSFEQLIMDCEIHDLIQAFVQGFAVNPETLAEDVIYAVGPRSHFLTAAHTRAHLREIWQPKVMDRSTWDDWVKKGRPSAKDKARAMAKQILASHAPEPPACADRIREIIEDYSKRKQD
jgi:trimethylamine:corrinoid methyltransferase-like protein